MAEPKMEPQSLDEMLAEEADLAAEGEALLAELDAVRAERDDFKDRFMRALADAENTRKRAERDRREAENYGATRLARDLLPIYDNLRRALDTVTDDLRTREAPFVEGIDLTMREVLNIFQKHNLKIIAPLPGTKAGDIIQVATEGFMLHDRLLRPAQVGVSSMPSS